LKQAQTAEQCVGNELKQAFQRFAPILKSFGEELSKCFNSDCPKPGPGQLGARPPPPGARPPPPPPPPQHKAPNVSHDVIQCAVDTGKHFFQCLNESHLLPHGLPPPPAGPGLGGPGGPQGGPGPQFGLGPQFGPGPQIGAGPNALPFHPDLKQIQSELLRLCHNNTDAAKNFFKCALDAANKTKAWPAIVALAEPTILVCVAGKNCSRSLSDSCKSELDSKRQQFCACRNSSFQFAQQDSACQAARQELKEKFQQHSQQQVKQQSKQVQSQHAFLPHPHLNICANDPCGDLLAKEKQFIQSQLQHHEKGVLASKSG